MEILLKHPNHISNLAEFKKKIVRKHPIMGKMQFCDFFLFVEGNFFPLTQKSQK